MPRIPGTFKNEPPKLKRDLSPQGVQAEQLLLGIGAIHAARYTLGDCTVIVSREPLADGFVWHASIAHPTRYPTWDEIKAMRYTAPELVDVPLMAQLLPKLEDESDWVDVHHNAFHVWEINEKEVR